MLSPGMLSLAKLSNGIINPLTVISRMGEQDVKTYRLTDLQTLRTLIFKIPVLELVFHANFQLYPFLGGIGSIWGSFAHFSIVFEL